MGVEQDISTSASAFIGISAWNRDNVKWRARKAPCSLYFALGHFCPSFFIFIASCLRMQWVSIAPGTTLPLVNILCRQMDSTVVQVSPCGCKLDPTHLD
jgi:hypothetical protein